MAMCPGVFGILFISAIFVCRLTLLDQCLEETFFFCILVLVQVVYGDVICCRPVDITTLHSWWGLKRLHVNQGFCFKAGGGTFLL